jgi:hypothetical protein
MRENPIPFVTKLKKLEAEGADSDKVESIRFEFLVDPSNHASQFPRRSSSLMTEAQRSTSTG